MSMRAVNIHEAKPHLSELLALALEGEEIIIAKANKLMVKLAPLEQPKKSRVMGLHKGEGEGGIADDFDAPLPDEFWLGNGPA